MKRRNINNEFQILILCGYHVENGHCRVVEIYVSFVEIQHYFMYFLLSFITKI